MQSQMSELQGSHSRIPGLFTVGLFLAKKSHGFAKWRFDHITTRDLTNHRFNFLDSLSSLLRIRLLNDIIETFQN